MAPNPSKNVPIKEKDLKLSRIYPETEGDEIVISGMSGRFPNSRNVAEYEHNLYNKIDMVEDVESRWKYFNVEIPKRAGKIYDLEKFDATFFDVHFKEAHIMDPQCRLLIESAYEAVLDAGINPRSLRGTRTGVFVGACISESEKKWFYENVNSGGFGITGCSRSMLANRISYTLGLIGPSFSVDTACSSSMYALDNAFSAFRNGEIDAAIVGGANLILHPHVTLQLARLGVLAPNGYCRPFDKSRTGFTRSESVTCIFLQRKRNAKRIYASLVYTKTNCDGYKPEGITYPGGHMQEKLLKEFYDNANVPLDELGFFETHGTATAIGDSEECRAIDNVICARRKEPLLIGSVKSNIGHSEPASGICSLIKVALAFQTGKIAPNLNFTKAQKDIPAIVEGRLKVVNEVEELRKPYIGVNSFGFGGANAHVLLKAYNKEKKNYGVPSDNLPRLVNWSSRTEDGINSVFNVIESNQLDTEFIGLVHNIQKEPIPGFVFRGYALYSHEEGKNAQCLMKDVQHFTGINRPIVWVFSGIGSQWAEMGTSLMKIPLFRESIEKSHRTLKLKGLDLIKILTSNNLTTFDNILHSFVGIAAIQIAIVDILKTLGIEPDYVVGHSVGELGCAYADDGFTAEQMILSSYSKGLVSIEMDKIKGSMATVELGYKDIKRILPKVIDIAYHNGPDSCTISGPYEDVTEFLTLLKEKSIIAKEIPCSNIAYHSRYIAHMESALLKRLKEVVPEPRRRSKKWLSSSVPKALWNVPENQLCSAEYHTRSLLNSVLFEETIAKLPSNALTIEIAPHGLLQAILKKSMPNALHIGLTQRGNKNNVNFFFGALGKLYLNGLHFPIERLYPKIDFPVARGTPMISPLVKWNHSKDWFVTKFENIRWSQSGEKVYTISLQSDNEEFLSGHVIDGKILMPTAGYLIYVWETLSLMRYGPNFMDMPVEFEDLKFLRALTLTKENDIVIIVMIHYGTGIFEITNNGTVVVTGTIRVFKNTGPPEPLPPLPSSKAPILYNKDFYKELRLRGYHYNRMFKAVEEARTDGMWAKIKWDYNWVTFLNCILQSHIIGFDSRTLRLPTRIRKLRINGKYHYEQVKNLEPGKEFFEMQSNRKFNRIICGGIEIVGLHVNPVECRKPSGSAVLERYQFIPHFPAPKLTSIDIARVCVELVLENNPSYRLKIAEVGSKYLEPIVPHFVEAIQDLPVVSGHYTILTSKDIDLPNVIAENKELSSQTNCTIVIVPNALKNDELIDVAQKSLDEVAFLLAREQHGLDVSEIQVPTGFHKVIVFPTENETFIYLQKINKKYVGTPNVVKISESDIEYEWIKQVKTSITKGPVLLVAQNEKYNGLLGLVNCLRKEPNGHLLKCVFIDDPKAPPFDMELPFYKSQLKLGMAVNVFRNGKWGTYRYLQLKVDLSEKRHKGLVIGNAKTCGDLSSITWFQGPNDYEETCDTKIVYASLNFRDVMLVTGRLPVELYQESRIDQTNLLGLEYAGYNKNGQRTMGIVLQGAIASYIDTSRGIKFILPEHLTFEEAATIPVAYITVYYAFFYAADIRKGKTILIHAGTGGIGLAAITIALAYGLEVFTTCSTKEKRQFLLERFPQLKESHIGNSRDTSFETMIIEETDGNGVDFVLNSLTVDKLLASVRCLGKGGHFFEIGKFDMANDIKMGLNPFLKQLTFHAVVADNILSATCEFQEDLISFITRDIMKGIIKPLPYTIFKGNELSKAFRYLVSGKHIGKVLVELHDDPYSEYTVPLQVLPQAYFDRNMVYIILGGLGGFGLELADWLIIRGVKKLVLSSRNGITKTYQLYRIHLWESYGIKIIINTDDDITTRRGCESLLKIAATLGPVGGIFNLALILQDAIFTNQTAEKFAYALAPKAVATKYLDELSRKMCPQLRHFVVFSSISCGRGNAGQSNYGMANSIMERIIEDRAAEGLPAKAIQWGTIGEVGIVADMSEDKIIDIEIGGTLQQRISSCLEELDPLLISPDPIVSSMVVAEKHNNSLGKANIIETIMNIMNIHDLKSISMGASLAEMGMDSLMVAEIRHTLERDFELFFTSQDLRSVTFQKLQSISSSRENGSSTISDPVKIRMSNTRHAGIGLLIRNLGDDANSGKSILPLKTKMNEQSGSPPCIIIPGFEGSGGQVWYNIATNLNSEAVLLQYSHTKDETTFEGIAKILYKDVQPILKKSKPFYIVAHSYGTLVALELARLLENNGYLGQMLFIDGAPHFLKIFCRDSLDNDLSDENLQAVLLVSIISCIFPEESQENLILNYSKLKGWDSKMEKFMELVEKKNIFSKEYVANTVAAIFNRIKTVLNVVDDCKPINTPVTLVRAAEVAVVDIDENYELSKIINGQVNLKFIDGDHSTMLDNPHLPEIIDEINPMLKEDKHIGGK